MRQKTDNNPNATGTLTMPSQPADPCVMVIFGATGDVTKRTLLPALYDLAKATLLSHEFGIVGLARNDMSTEAFREQISQDIKSFATTEVEPAIWDWFLQRIYYTSGNLQDPGTYQKLKGIIEQADQTHGCKGNYF